MIKINLLGEVKATDSSATLFFASWAAGLVLTLGLMFAFYQSTDSQITEEKGEIELLEAQLKNLKEKTKSVADLELKKKDLDDKLKVISILKRSKSGPVRVMDDLNMAMPDRSWLTGVRESENTLRMTGFALDNQTVAGFMQQLAKSDYFERVELVESKIATRENVKLRQFTLDGKISYAGKVKATPTPVSSPVAATASAASASSSSVASTATAASESDEGDEIVPPVTSPKAAITP